jgi:hypothetical protein
MGVKQHLAAFFNANKFRSCGSGPNNRRAHRPASRRYTLHGLAYRNCRQTRECAYGKNMSSRNPVVWIWQTYPGLLPRRRVHTGSSSRLYLACNKYPESIDELKQKYSSQNGFSSTKQGACGDDVLTLLSPAWPELSISDGLLKW